MEPTNKTSNIVVEAESAKSIQSSETPIEEPVAFFPSSPIHKPKTEPQTPSDAKETLTGLMSVEHDSYSAWVVRVSETVYQAHLALKQGSAYHWDASSPTEAEDILNYHIVNMKL